MRRTGSRSAFSGWIPIAVAAAIVAGGSTRAGAEEPSPASVTLEELMRIALRESPLLRARGAEHRAALERVPQAGALPDPELAWEFEAAPLERPSPADARENRFRLSQHFPFPGKRGLARSVASADADVVNASLEAARLDVATALRESFYHLHHLYVSIEILEESHEALRALAEIATQRYAVGQASQHDVLKADVELASEDARLAALREEIPAVESRIRAIVGGDAATPLGRPEAPELVNAPATADSLVALALEHSPAVRAADARVERARSGVGLARTESRPELMFGAGYMIMKDEPDAWMGMVGMTLPIWRGGKAAPMRREADAGLAAAQSESDQARRDVTASVHEARAAVVAARARAQALADRALPRAEQSFESTRFAYQNGHATFLELLDAQRTLLAIRFDSEEALMDALVAEAGLAAAVGDLPEVRDE